MDGVILGFVGAILVIGLDIGKSLPQEGIISAFVALLAVTFTFGKKN